MRKRSICLILLLLLTLTVFCGCNLQMTMLPNNTKPTATKPIDSTEPTEPAETTNPTEAPKPTEPVYLEQPKEDPVRPASMPADVPNMENGIYATCGNYYYTLYMNPEVANEHIRFYLMSENPLPDDAEIVTNLQTEHKVHLIDRTPKKMAFNTYLDAVVQGNEIDWAQLYQLERKNYDTMLDYVENKITWDEYVKAAQTYWDAWCLLIGYDGSGSLGDSRPTAFYYYEVDIYIGKYQMDEELTFAQLVSGENVIRDLPIGEIRLRKLVDPSTKELNEKVILRSKELVNIPVPSISHSAEGAQYTMALGGMAKHQVISDNFLAKEDMSLTDAYFFANGGENCSIVSVEVLLIPTDGHKATGDPIQMRWEPGTPLQIRKNDLVQVQVCFVDSWYQMAEYAGKQYLVLEYRYGTETGRRLSSAGTGLTRKWTNEGELYLWAFTDVDVEGYYNEFYIPIQKYLTEIGGMPNITNPNIPAIS